MVKPDAKRNYYADLEISPTADVEEIKKQFRKLARLYHPDRNPGKELEYVPKFQAIQAAHEILSDPETRAKYDAERRTLAGQRPAPPPRAGAAGPQADANWRSPYEKYSNFPPPRMRTQAGQNPPRPSSYGAYPAGSTGSARTPNYANNVPRRPPPTQPQAQHRPPPPPPPPPPRQTNAKDDSEARRKLYTAWERMGPNQRPHEQTWSDDDGLRRARAAQDAANAHTSRPGLGRSNTTKGTPRKAGGFNPSRMSGDWEPQAKSTSSYQAHTQPQAPPPQHKSHDSTPQPTPDPFHHFRQRTGEEDVPYAEGTRVRTPYASQGVGQKTYFTTEGLAQSSSMRDTLKTAREAASRGPSPRVNVGRPRSASPGGRGTSSQNSSGRRASAHHPGGSTRGAGFTLDGQSSSESSDGEPSTSSDTSKKPLNGDASGSQSRRTAKPGKSWAQRSRNATDGAQTAPESPVNGATQQPPIFSFSNVERGHNLRSSSSDQINTKFSTQEWAGSFKGAQNGNDQDASEAQRDGYASQNVAGKNDPIDHGSSHMGSQANSLNTNGTKIPPPPPLPPNFPASATFSGEVPADNHEPVKFSKEQWEETIKSQSFFYPSEETSRSASPSKSNNIFKKPKIPKGRKQSKSEDKSKSGPYSISSDASDEESEVPLSKAKTTPNPPAMDGDAMDIDSESPLAASKSSSPKAKRGPRMVNAPPHRPEWQHRSSIPTTPEAEVAGTTPTIPRVVPRNVTLPPPPPGPPPTDGPAMSNTKEKRDASLNLDSFRSAAPFAPSGEGLSAMHDLSGTLPFQSQASEHASKTFAPRPLALPNPPKAPIPPQGQQIHQWMWRQYMAQMAFYQGQWYRFNAKMLSHFQARHANSIKFGTGEGQASTEAMRLLEAGGEASGDDAGGYMSYLKGMDEDVRVQRHWDAAREKHKYAIEQLLAFKRSVYEGKVPLLPDVK